MRNVLKLICLFLFAFFSLHADEDIDDISQLEIVLSGECEPLTTVADCVNVVSGSFFQIEKDLVGNTIDPLSLTRYYDSNNENETFVGYGFGSQFPLIASEMQDRSRHSYALISERDGFLIPYRSKIHSDHTDKRKTCHIDPRLIEKGYTNLSRVEISGLSNFVNWRATHRPEDKKQGWIVQLGDRSQRTYGIKTELSKTNRKKIGLPSKVAYLLTEEIKPNGNRLLFNYEISHGKPYLTKIQTQNRTGDAILNELNVSYSHNLDENICRVKSGCGSRIDYHQIHVPHSHKILTHVSSSQRGDRSYGFIKSSHPRLGIVKKPRGQNVEVIYNAYHKVAALLEPLGPNKEIVNTYNFYYDGDHETTVINPLLLMKQYQFDHHRLSRISYYSAKYRYIFHPPPKGVTPPFFKLLKQERFTWSKKPGEEGWLKAKWVCLEDEIYHLKSFDYDHRGNITKEKFYGNLTGKKPETFNQLSQAESYCVEYAYTKDGRNLLIEKKTPEGLTIQYDYLPGTNLRTKELQIYDGKIQGRIFRDFDNNGQPKKIIQDDGSGPEAADLTNATFRLVKTIISEKKKNTSAFGKPKRIVEAQHNFNTGKLKTLKITAFEYDQNGNEIKQTIRNSKDEFCYEIIKEYDLHLRLKKEINPLGHTTIYDYDNNNNRTYEEVLESGKITFYEYDHVNRLEVKKEQHQNGELFATGYAYNHLHQIVSEIDPYGNETNYEYDHLGRQTKCLKPCIQDSTGDLIRPIISKEYNPLDQVVASTNETGFTTKYSYNIYGQPTRISYPDESTERLIYYPCGWLKQKWFADGTSIQFTYDPKGHILTETTLDKDKNRLKEETSHYKGDLLQSKTDAMGLVTNYFYNGAGLKTREVIGDNLKEIRYAYDDFGRLIKTSSFLEGQECQIELRQYDWLNRLISKTLQDHTGTLYSQESYEYDIHGNQTKKSTHQAGDNIATHYSEYNSDNTLKIKEDPLKNQTRYFYDHNHKNELNQGVQSRLIHDPLGRPTKEVDHVNGKLFKKVIFDGDKKVSHTIYAYDAAGNLIKQTAQVMIEGEVIREYAIEWSYDCRGRVQSETELPNGKITIFIYDAMGRLFQKAKPDGIVIEYTYDALGRLATMTSSDQSIGYTYEYDLHDNPIIIHDLVNQTIQKRRYDLLDRLQEEEISPSIIISYEYDKLDRLIKMKLPDHSYVKYIYDAFHLKKVMRFSADNKLKYEYACEEYDLFGNLLKSRSPAGETVYAYDLLGRKIGIQTNLWESEQLEFDPVGNLKILKQKDPDGELVANFSYDRFDHLKSESGIENNRFQYDSLGNCVQKNKFAFDVNSLNQVENDAQCNYKYDLNGNLIKQTNPPITYAYDALNRLICLEQEEGKTSFIYDAFGRCLQIVDQSGKKNLLHNKNKEIGSVLDGRLHEFRLTHPKETSESVFAIELNGEVYFPLQDARYNISALKRSNGTLAEWSRYSVFGKEVSYNDGVKLPFNPWRFANRRSVAGLLQFQHRYYHPNLMRWLTTDPAGFEEGLNLYSYVRNNPFYYSDPDGRWAFVIPIVEGIICLTEIIISAPTIGAILGSITGGLLGIGVYEACKRNDVDYREEETLYEYPVYNQEQANPYSVYAPERPLPMDENGVPIPDTDSEHTQLGTGSGRKGKYPQAREFDKGGQPVKEIDFTDHGRPHDHTNPHQHRREKNPTGGTRTREDAEPMSGWKY